MPDFLDNYCPGARDTYPGEIREFVVRYRVATSDALTKAQLDAAMPLPRPLRHDAQRRREIASRLPSDEELSSIAMPLADWLNNEPQQ